MATTTRQLTWRWTDNGFDRATVVIRDDGWRISGQHGSTRYAVATDQEGSTRAVKVSWQDPEGVSVTLALNRDSADWHDEKGALIAGSGQAYDVDIACTALTNTLPIKRLQLGIDDSAEIDVLYIPIPPVTPRVVRQRSHRTPGGYLYENHDSGFRANLAVDTAGWVTDYPGVCHLIEGAS